MKTKRIILILLIFIFSGCIKFGNSLHKGTVLALTCPFEGTSSVAVQVDNKDPLSFTWTNPFTNVVYPNVIVTYIPALNDASAVGKTLTYTTVRKPNSTDTLGLAIPAICVSYPMAYLNNITIK